MMVITKQQFDVFDAYFDKQFRKETQIYFREKYANYINNPALFNDFIDQQITEAAAFGFTKSENIIEYIDYCLHFDILTKDPIPIEIVKILTYPDRLPERKLEVLAEFLKLKR